MSFKLILVVVTVICIAVFFTWQVFAYKTPEPKYNVVRTSGAIEIRDYPEVLVAEVTVKGERYAAINDGFRILANFIFGNNTNNTKIAMTAPVIQQGTKIAMTAPVTQQEATDGWVVRFIMPANYNKETLPKPNNKTITIISIPATQYAVIRFSGRNSDANIKDHLQILQNYLQENHMETTGSPILAFYNPPWILPFLRRNEILLQLKH